MLSSFSSVVNRIEKIRSGEIDFFLKSEFNSPKVDQQSNQHFNLMNAYQSPIVTDEERLIHQQLKSIKPEEAVGILVKHLAHANFQGALLSIHSAIYPNYFEQIEILKYLNTIPSCKDSDLHPFYDKWLNRGGDRYYTFDRFLGFLLDQKLIDDYRSTYAISALGKEYLMFLVKIGKG